jgi:hypothetical protein
MKNLREIDQATATNPQSRGGLLPLGYGDDDEDVGEGGDLSGGTSGGVPPLIFTVVAYVLVFRCFCGALLEETL